MKKNLARLVFAALLLLPSAAMAQQMPSLPLDKDVKFGVLDNGITYYIRHNEEPKDRVNFYIAQKVGSIQEDDSQQGLAHFLEHMCFNGSVNFPADGALIKYCESIGVKFGQNLNAYTSTDETVYNIDDIPVTENNLDSCLLILHDWADGLLLEPAEIDKERGVIHEEWRMRSSAQQRMLQKALPELYPGSKYAHRMPIGLMSVVDNFSPEFLRSYYETWYRPDLQGIVIVGDVDVNAMEAKIKNVFGSIKMPENPRAFESYPVPSNEHAIYVVESDKEQRNALVLAMFKTDPLPAEMRNTMMYYIEDYMTSVMCSAITARLNEASQKPDCPFVAAQVGYGEYIMSKTMDCLEVYVVAKPGLDKEAVQAAMTEIERARRYGITATEVQRAKEEFLSREEKVYDNRAKQKNSYYVDKYVRRFLDGNAAPGIETEHQIYKAIAQQLPADAISQSFQQLTASTDSNFVLLAMYPEKEGVAVPGAEVFKAAVEAARTADIQAYVDNVKDEPLVSKLPKKGKIKSQTEAAFGYTKLSLANGANVYYRQTDFNESQIILSATSKGGLSLVPEKDLVNAQLMPDVINNQGKGNFTATELEKALAGKQVTLRVDLRAERETMSGNTTPKDLETLFQLIYLAFQEPANDPDAYSNIIASMRTSLENAEKMPMQALQDSISTTLYGKNPYTRNIKLADLDKADYATIKNIYRQRFASAGDFDFFFTGNIDAEVLKSYVEQYIAPLKKCKREAAKDIHATVLPGERTNRFTRQMETPQAYIFQVWSGTDPYSMKESVAVEALGSILSQRYLKSIREDAGMAYSVQSQGTLSRDDFRDEYILESVCPFTPAKCDSVLYLMKKGIDEIAEGGVKDTELTDFIKFETKDYEDSQRKNGYWQSLIMAFVQYGMDKQTGYRETVEALSSDDIKNFVTGNLLKQGNCATIVMLPADMTEKE